MNEIIFVSGLPRSGSTLIMNILGQNPKHYVTPTSGLANLVVLLQKEWSKQTEFRAEGLNVVKPRIRTAIKGMLEGYYDEPLSSNKIVFDKSRAWLQYIEDLERVLDKRVKVIVPIRDVREILASFEKLYRKRDVDYHYPIGENYFSVQNAQDRASFLLRPNNVVGLAINRVRDAIRRISDRLIIVPFDSLTASPKETFNALHDSLKLEPFEYDFSNVKQLTQEDDTWHGLDLHIIKPKVQPLDNYVHDMLPKEYSDMVGEKYKNLNSMAGSKF